MNQTESHSLKEKKMSKFDAFLAILQKKWQNLAKNYIFVKIKWKKKNFLIQKNEKNVFIL